jgi:hypothetical protein
MAKGGSKRQRHQTQSGGMGATEWVNNLLGNGWQQFQNSLMTQPGSNLGSVQSNQIVPNDGSKGVNINDPKNVMPNPNGSPQNGGKTRRKGRKGRGKKGGMLGVGAVIEQAVVPFGLFGLQQSYGKSRRHHGSKRSRRSRRFRR